TLLFSCDHPLLVVLLFKEQSMAEATEYDKLQDQRLDDLESLITAEYEPPEGTEYSFPVANQGITQEQFRLMFLGQANGMIHGDNGTINDSPDSTGKIGRASWRDRV